MKFKLGQRVRATLPEDKGFDSGTIIYTDEKDYYCYMVLLDSKSVTMLADLQYLECIDEKLKDPNKHAYWFPAHKVTILREEKLNLL